MLIFLLATLAVVAAVSKKPQQQLDASLLTCNHTREAAISYARLFGDGDLDGKLCPAEIVELKSNVLNLLERFLAWFYSIEKIMGDCDYDGDGFLTERDFQQNGKTCMKTCTDVEKFFFYVVEPAQKMNYTAKRVACTKKKN